MFAGISSDLSGGAKDSPEDFAGIWLDMRVAAVLWLNTPFGRINHRRRFTYFKFREICRTDTKRPGRGVLGRELRADYRKWLRFYLDFCGKYDHPATSTSSVPLFMAKLARLRRQWASIWDCPRGSRVSERRPWQAIQRGKGVSPGGANQKGAGRPAGPMRGRGRLAAMTDLGLLRIRVRRGRDGAGERVGLREGQRGVHAREPRARRERVP